jgi:hypothetical protein
MCFGSRDISKGLNEGIHADEYEGRRLSQQVNELFEKFETSMKRVIGLRGDDAEYGARRLASGGLGVGEHVVDP